MAYEPAHADEAAAYGALFDGAENHVAIEPEYQYEPALSGGAAALVPPHEGAAAFYGGLTDNADTSLAFDTEYAEEPPHLDEVEAH